MQKLLCPSMMCANFSNLEKEVDELSDAGADIFHIDIMDGNYVPNFGMGIQDLSTIREKTDKQVDVHLMIMDPNRYIEQFINLGADIIYIHPEVDLNPVSTLQKIKNMGAQAGIAISPGIHLNSVLELIPYCDFIMIMTVNPGFSGQDFLENTVDKIKKIIHIQKDFNFKVMVDGAISSKKVQELSGIGVNGFVLGTSALFNQSKNYKETITNLRDSMGAYK